MSKITSKTKNIIIKTSKMKSPTEIINTRSITEAKKTRNRKAKTSISQTKEITQKEKHKITKNKKLSKEDINITVKSENIVTHNNSNMNKQESKNKKRKLITGVKKNISKQMSLKESFLNQSKIHFLRSSKNSKNSMNGISTKKLSINKKKLPIYKHVSPEKQKENISEIYEFKFDINDSNERLPKKQKKIVTKRKVTNRKKKNIPVKQVAKKKSIIKKSEEIKNSDFIEFETKKKDSMEHLNIRSNILKENVVKNLKPNIEVNKQLKNSENIIKEHTIDEITTKPTIISVKDLSDKKISIIDTSQISNSNDFKPFRPTNIFNNKQMIQQNNTLNYSLFEKSLSPIRKSLENSQMLCSPWRASLLTFSQVKNIFQSTPKNNNYDIINKKLVRTLNESKQFANVTKTKNTLQKNNENISTEEHININTSKKKNLLTLRKFGTEITNIDHSLQFKSSIEQINEHMPIETENIQSNIQSISVITSNVNNAFKFDNKEIKKNSILSPKKSFKKEIINTQIQENILNIKANDQKENFISQPGPSGLQNNSIFNEKRILKQSNLNNFLNIMELPQCTTIKTPHGIFDDTQSISIINKSMKKFNESNIKLNNTFGFSDSESDQEVSSIKIENNKQEKFVQSNVIIHDIKLTARLSIDEIKNKLLIKNLKEEKDKECNKENILIKNKEIKKLPIKEKKKQIDILNFSDTFDILSETGGTSVVSSSNIPLFTDFEPSHFTQPPRHSYKRKRNVKYSFSEEESEEEEMESIEHEIKRKKTNKMKMEQEKRLQKWVQDINRTFHEIDQHELISYYTSFY
ncbi:hypothetical protein APICC_08353 [Apis cerana cerana]|uniref:Uncharacterized protein n=1 Tax=Apis cerana cerana TaxID=94128 RepID=A0A2A3EQ40_APICC|nr:hypothetical protein APICC_08353 [Apis cerana cerana]